MRISDWSSDVCSSDLVADAAVDDHVVEAEIDGAIGGDAAADPGIASTVPQADTPQEQQDRRDGEDYRIPVVRLERDRKSVVEGKSVSDRVDLGGRRIIKKKQQDKQTGGLYMTI